jgi:hypothetical protein
LQHHFLKGRGSTSSCGGLVKALDLESEDLD